MKPLRIPSILAILLAALPTDRAWSQAQSPPVSSSPPEATIFVIAKDKGTTLSVARGQRVTVLLYAHTETGHRWHVDEYPRQTVRPLGDPAGELNPQKIAARPGEGEPYFFYFQAAAKPGEVDLVFRETKPGVDKPRDLFAFTMKVREPEKAPPGKDWSAEYKRQLSRDLEKRKAKNESKRVANYNASFEAVEEFARQEAVMAPIVAAQIAAQAQSGARGRQFLNSPGPTMTMPAPVIPGGATYVPAGATYVDGYFRGNGTYVRGYWRGLP